MKTGQTTADEIEIVDGIYEGDEVVVQGAKQLRAQSLISLSNEGEKEASQSDKAKDTTQFPQLLLGILLGMGLMLGLGIVWFYISNAQKSKRHHKQGNR